MKSQRIQWMDGLRGIAIIMVVLCHLYGPPDTAVGPDSILPLGWVGVELFFLISGFVILMTLERCGSFSEFVHRRWLRLFPAMLVCSLITLAYDHAVGVGPFAHRSIADLIPGLLFISPGVIHAATRVSLNSMDYSYWSLYVEVFFYLIFGSAFFVLGRSRAIAVILSMFAITYVLAHLPLPPHSLLGRIGLALDWLGPIYFCWFAAGALFYRASLGEKTMFWYATGLVLVAVVTQKVYVGTTLQNIPALLLVSALFIWSQRSRALQRVLASRVLVFFGFVSYPLYLVHENISVGLTELLGERVANLPRWLLPLAPIALMVLISWLIAQYAEPALRATFSRRLNVAAKET